MNKAFIALNQSPIAFYPIYADLTGSITGGVLLSQIMYWFGQMKGERFYKTDADLMQETRLTETEFKNAKKRIADLSFIDIIRDRVSNRTYYCVDVNEAISAIEIFESMPTKDRKKESGR
jgi:hypothetical protein